MRNMNEVWDDAIAALNILVTRHGARATLDTLASEPTVKMVNRKGKMTAQLYWRGVNMGWAIKAVGHEAVNLPEDTHPRVMARELYQYELNVTA